MKNIMDNMVSLNNVWLSLICKKYNQQLLPELRQTYVYK